MVCQGVFAAGNLRCFRECLRMTEFWRTAKLCTAFFGCLCIVVLVSILREPVSAKTAYSVRVYTFAPKAAISPDFVDWDTSSPVATDGRGDVAFVVDKYLDTFSAVVWHADGSVSTIAPPRADLAKAFRIYNVGPHGEEQYPEPPLQIESLAFFGGGLAVTNRFTFGGGYTGIERGIWILQSGRQSLLGVFTSNDPYDHRIAASDGARLAIVSQDTSSAPPSNDSLPPHYWDPQSSFYDGRSLHRIGRWTVTSIAGEFFAGYDLYADPIQQAKHPDTDMSRRRALRWHAGKLEVLGAGFAVGVNDRGTVVGATGSPRDQGCPVVFSSMKPRCLIDRPGIAYSIAADGAVVGFYIVNTNEEHAFIARGEHVTDLSQLVPVRPGRTLQRAFAIDSSGRIVAYGTEAGRKAVFVLEPK